MPRPQNPWHDVISAEATKQGLDPSLALAVADTESSFNPDAHNPSGAHGLFQLMPETATRLGVDINDPLQNIRGGITELKRLIGEHGSDLATALRRYNGSPRASTQATDPYVQRVFSKIAQYQTPDTVSPNVGKPPPAVYDPSKRTQATPFSAEQFMTTGQKVARTAGNVAAEIGAGVDPRTPTGRRNIAGGVGAATAAALTEGASLIPSIIGAAGGGMLAETGEQIAGTKPASGRAIVGAGAEQGAYETAGQIIPWGVKAVGRRAIATTVGKSASEALTAARSATTARLADALDTASRAAGDVKEAAARATRFTRADVADRLKTARTTSAAGIERAKSTGAAGVEKATAEGASGVQRASDQATAAEAAAEAPYSALVGQRPSAAIAGREAESVIRGPAQDARDIAGQAVDAAARSGPTVDLKPLKKSAQQIVDSVVGPPEKTFPRSMADGTVEVAGVGVPKDVADAFQKQMGVSLTDAAKDPRYASMVAGYLKQLPTDATNVLGAAQEEAGRETLKHPVMKIVNRILNADDQVPFHDLHLWKSELQNALAGTYDKAQKKQITSLTEHLTAQMRDALSVHQPYNEATAKYASIVPLYTKEYAAAFRRAAATDPESLVRMIKPGKPTALRMLRDLLVTQSADAGKGAEGQAAWDGVRGAWTHANLLKGGVAKLGENLDKLPKDFADIFFGDANGKSVLSNLQQISSAYRSAKAAGLAGVEAAEASSKSGIEAAKASSQAGIDAARTAGRAGVEQTQKVGAQAIEQQQRAAAGVRRQAAEDIRGARRSLSDFRRTPTPQEKAFADSSLARRQMTGEETLGHIGRAAFVPGYWGWISRAKLVLGGAAEKDLIEWAAYSPKNTQRLVGWMTGQSPTGLTLSNLARMGVPQTVLQSFRRAGMPETSPIGTPPPR